MVNQIDLLIDLVAIEDVADLAEVENVIRWLHAKGMIDVRRMRECHQCKTPFVARAHGQTRRFCSLSCRQKAYRPIWAAKFDANRTRRLEYRRKWYAKKQAQGRAA